MGTQLLAKLLPTLEKATWPQNPRRTDLGRRTYEISLDNINTYRDDPKVLAAALRTLLTSDSRPYTFAGVAYLLIAAAREADGSYAPEGLEAAMSWLEKAQETEPDVVEINVVEAFVYIYAGRLDDARTVLDYLQEQDPHSYYLQTAEFAYWLAEQDIEQIEYWFQRAVEMARTVPQRLRLLSLLADAYAAQQMWPQALLKYKEAIHFDAENHWLLHHASQACWQLGDYEEASRFNKRALKVKDFPEGRQMEAALKEKSGSTGMLGRLFGGQS